MGEELINVWLQGGSNAFLDSLMLILTQMGDELFFLIIVMLAFWCVDKRFGFKMVNVYLIGTITSTVMKNIFRRPRPYTLETVRSIGEETGGFSFPSGHSHSIANLSSQISLRYKRAWVIVTAAAVTLTVMFTRVYLGQHYLTDVIAGCALGILSALVFSFLFELLGDREENIAFVIAPLCLVAAIICACLKVETKAIFDVTGGYAGVTLGYYLEKRFVGFSPKAKLWQNAVKVGVGAIIVLAIKEGLKAVFKLLGITNLLVYSFLRYFLTAFIAIYLVPMLFKALKLYKREN